MFILKFILSLIFLFTLWIAIVFFQIGNPTKMSQWVYDVYSKKINIAQKIKEKKLLIVSGSNALFGIDSKMLSDSLDIKVVNFAVNAGVMLPYTLYKAKEVINQGDIVLLPLEYSMYNYDGIPNEQMIDYILSRDFKVFFELSFKEQFYIFWNVPFKRIYNGYFNNSNNKVNRGLYGSHNVDENGDQINIGIKNKSKAIEKELDNHKANYYGAEFEKNTLTWKYLDSFVQWCKENNVETIFVPSTLLGFDIYKSDTKERLYYELIPKLIKDKNWNYVGNPYDYMYEKEFYFNTDFHLNHKGRIKRTKQLIEDLNSFNLLNQKKF